MCPRDRVELDVVEFGKASAVIVHKPYNGEFEGAAAFSQFKNAAPGSVVVFLPSPNHPTAFIDHEGHHG